jgi:16S rRNA (uracil1498-N3)-methyltransferase
MVRFDTIKPMKIHRFIDTSFNLNESQCVVKNPEIVNQWVNVLRFKIGDTIIICDGNGFESQATITKIANDSVELALQGKVANTVEPRRHVTLYAAVLKKENFELVVQKAVEVGVVKIVPILTERTVKQNVRIDRLVKIAQEAAEQSGRGIIPQVTEPVSFAQAIASATHAGATFLFDITATDSFAQMITNNDPISICIGPEGGFSEAEITEARNLGAVNTSLGSRVLRGETAAIVASWVGVNA